MTEYFSAVIRVWSDPLAITLAHILWQSLLIAGVLFVLLKLMPARLPGWRYLLSLGAMGAVVVCASVTFSVVSYEAPVPSVSSKETAPVVARKGPPAPKAIQAEKPAIVPAAHSVDGQVEDRVVATQSNSTVVVTDPPRLQDIKPAPVASPQRPVIVGEEIASSRALRLAPWVCVVWMLGVAGMIVRMGLLLLSAGKARQRSVPVTDPVVLGMMESLLQRLGLQRPVPVAMAQWVRSPVMLGVLRPVILLPASVLTAIPPDDLRAILAHELVHIRRYDFLINLIQMVVEAFFFFSPLLWWISRQVRVEREACCDALAAEVAGGNIGYASALARFAELVRETPPSLETVAPAFGEPHQTGSLLDRVKRMAVPRYRPPLRVSWSTLLMAILLSATMLACVQVGTKLAAKAWIGVNERHHKELFGTLLSKEGEVWLLPVQGEGAGLRVVSEIYGDPVVGATVRLSVQSTPEKTISGVSDAMGMLEIPFPDAVEVGAYLPCSVEVTSGSEQYEVWQIRASGTEFLNVVVRKVYRFPGVLYDESDAKTKLFKETLLAREKRVSSICAEYSISQSGFIVKADKNDDLQKTDMTWGPQKVSFRSKGDVLRWTSERESPSGRTIFRVFSNYGGMSKSYTTSRIGTEKQRSSGRVFKKSKPYPEGAYLDPRMVTLGYREWKTLEERFKDAVFFSWQSDNGYDVLSCEKNGRRTDYYLDDQLRIVRMEWGYLSGRYRSLNKNTNTSYSEQHFDLRETVQTEECFDVHIVWEMRNFVELYGVPIPLKTEQRSLAPRLPPAGSHTSLGQLSQMRISRENKYVSIRQTMEIDEESIRVNTDLGEKELGLDFPSDASVMVYDEVKSLVEKQRREKEEQKKEEPQDVEPGSGFILPFSQREVSVTARVVWSAEHTPVKRVEVSITPLRELQEGEKALKTLTVQTDESGLAHFDFPPGVFTDSTLRCKISMHIEGALPFEEERLVKYESQQSLALQRMYPFHGFVLKKLDNGRVVPAPGATVVAVETHISQVGYNKDENTLWRFSSVADESGMFFAPSASSMPVRIWARQGEFVTLGTPVPRGINQDGTAGPFDIYLERGKTFSVSVLDKATSKPISNAEVLVSFGNRAMEIKYQTDTEGICTVPGLPIGAIDVLISAPGYAREQIPLQMGDSQSDKQVIIGLKKGGKVKIKTVAQVPRVPFGNVDFSIRTGRLTFNAKSGDDGTIVVDGIPFNQECHISPTGKYGAIFEGIPDTGVARSVIPNFIIKDDKIPEVELPVKTKKYGIRRRESGDFMQTVRGKVVSEAGLGIPDALVTVYPSDNRRPHIYEYPLIASTVTGETGRFLIDYLGELTVSVEAEGYYGLKQKVKQNEEMKLVLKKKSMCELGVRVLDSLTKAPVTDYEITCRSGYWTQAAKERNLSHDGRAVIGNVPTEAENTKIFVSAAGYLPLNKEIVPSEEKNIELHLTPVKQMGIRLVDADSGEPLDKVEIRKSGNGSSLFLSMRNIKSKLKDESQSLPIFTNSEGRIQYEQTSIEETLIFLPEEYEHFAVKLSGIDKFFDSETGEYIIPVEKSPSATLKMQFFYGKEIIGEGKWVRISSQGTVVRDWERKVESKDGYYCAEDLPAGEYTIRCMVWGEPYQRNLIFRLALKKGEQKVVRLAEGDASGISGRVLYSDGKPVTDKHVFFNWKHSGEQNGNVYPVHTYGDMLDDEGQFEIKYMLPGDYSFQVKYIHHFDSLTIGGVVKKDFTIPVDAETY